MFGYNAQFKRCTIDGAKTLRVQRLSATTEVKNLYLCSHYKGLIYGHLQSIICIYLGDTSEINSGDVLVLMNGRKVKSKEKLVERLANDKSVTLTVIDASTKKLLEELEIEITEELSKFHILYR